MLGYFQNYRREKTIFGIFVQIWELQNDISWSNCIISSDLNIALDSVWLNEKTGT